MDSSGKTREIDYISRNWETLSVTMNANANQTSGDRLQRAISVFNNGKPHEAIVMLEEMYQKDSLNYSVKEYCGMFPFS